MRNKLLALIICLPLLFSCGTTAFAESYSYTAAEVEGFCGGIVAYKAAQCGANGAQELIDSGLCDSAGVSSEFYIMALSQTSGYDFGSYVRALKSYLSSHEVYSATGREKYALALVASGSGDGYISDVADEAIGGQGLMSLVFGLHILNNGYDSAVYSTDGLIGEILSRQLDDGGWAVMGSYGDADVTAMTLQALAPHRDRGDVAEAADRALGLLSSMQLDSGGYRSMGVENCESSAQVLIALSDLGIDAQRDAGFIKNGSVLDAILSYRNADGSFSHTGGGFNETATVQAFCAMTAYLRMCRGQGPFYVFDRPSDYVPPQDNGAQPDSGSYSQSGEPDGGSSDGPEQNTVYINGGRSAGTAATEAQKAEPTAAGTQGAEPQASAPAQQPSYGGFQPSATTAAATADELPSDGGYKAYAVLAVLLIAFAVCLILFLLKKRNKKNYIAVGIIAAAIVIIILLTDIDSAGSYKESAVSGSDMTVTMSVRCDTITGMEKVNDYIPDDGVIMDTAEFTVSEGDTVYDVLLEASKTRGLPIDNRGARGAAYIAAINYLYEFDYGDLSGWMYRVNGEFPDVGCQSCRVSDGDTIEWLYTTNIGKDLE